MPKVGNKKFPYTKKGKADAKAYAKRTGKKINWEGPYLGYNIEGTYPIKKSLKSLLKGEILIVGINLFFIIFSPVFRLQYIGL